MLLIILAETVMNKIQFEIQKNKLLLNIKFIIYMLFFLSEVYETCESVTFICVSFNIVNLKLK